MRRALLLSLATAAFAAPRCNDSIQVPVAATALSLIDLDSVTNLKIIGLSGNGLKALLTSLPTRNFTGNYTIAGRYCEPEVYNASRANTIQFLVHGVLTDRNYWSGLGLPGSPQQVNGTEYSWVDYASQQGYPTFSIDRICNGQSSHPEAGLCQLRLNAETIHGIVQKLRRGDIGGRPFKKIILVTHSLGSLSANVHSKLYPYDVEAYLLTGYSLQLIIAVGGATSLFGTVPAALILPKRYGSLGPDYLVSNSRSGHETLSYYGSYREALVDIDFARTGTVALGEVVTALSGTVEAPRFTGHVFVLTGQEDQIFCARFEYSANLGIPGDCGYGEDSASSQVRVLYSNAESFSWAQTQNAGHNINLHTNANATFATAHDWMNSLF